MTRTFYNERIRKTQSHGKPKDPCEAHINGVDLKASADAVWVRKSEPRLQPLCIHSLFALDIPERQMILDPIVPEKGLIMLYATRGVGKTHLAVSISLAVAAGTKYLNGMQQGRGRFCTWTEKCQLLSCGRGSDSAWMAWTSSPNLECYGFYRLI